MEHHPHDNDPSPHELDAREKQGEQTPDDDINFLVEAVHFGISDAVTNALAEGRPLTLEDARLVASIATGLSTQPAFDVLERFMASGAGDPAQVRDAVLTVHNPERHSAETHATLDWLSTYLLHAAYPSLTPQKQPLMRGATVSFPDGRASDGLWKTLAWCTPELLIRGDQDALQDRLIALMHKHGDPFRAYLRLPGVNALDPELSASFRAAYSGSTNDHVALDGLMPSDAIDAVDLSGRIHIFRVSGETGGRP